MNVYDCKNGMIKVDGTYIEDAQIYKNTVISFCTFIEKKEIPYIFPLINDFLNIDITPEDIQFF